MSLDTGAYGGDMSGKELERHCFEDKVVPLSINGDCMKLVLA